METSKFIPQASLQDLSGTPLSFLWLSRYKLACVPIDDSDPFDLILYVPSTIFQLNRDGSSWVEPVLCQDKCVLLKDHNVVTPVRLEPAASRSRVKHSTTEPLRSRPVLWPESSMDHYG